MDPFRTRDAYVHWVCKSPQQHQKQHSRQQQPKTLTATKINAPLRSNSKNNLPQQHQKLPRSNSKKTSTAKTILTKWIGCRKFRLFRPQRNRHDHPVVEGSKMIGFTRSSPSRVWKLQLKSKRFSHLVLLSRTLGPSNIFFLRLSVTHSCKHLFVCPCVEAILPDEGRV